MVTMNIEEEDNTYINKGANVIMMVESESMKIEEEKETETQTK